MFAGQGKLIFYGLGTGVMAIIGLLFIVVAPETGDPLRNQIIGVVILVGGVTTSIGFYVYNWAFKYSNYETLGMLLRVGKDSAYGEIWVRDQPFIELTKDNKPKKETSNKDKTKQEEIKDEETENSLQVTQVESEDDIKKINDMISDVDKEDVMNGGGRFYYNLMHHIGDIEGRELLVTTFPVSGMFDYVPGEVMIKDLPSRVTLSYGTGVQLGRHDIFIEPEKPKGWKRLTNFTKSLKEEKLYESVRVWMITDSDIHGKRVKYALGKETPEKENVTSAMDLITTIDSAKHIAINKLLEEKIKNLTDQLMEKIIWAAYYSKKFIYEGDEKSVGKKLKEFEHGPFWNWKNIALIIILGMLFIVLMYYIGQGAFSLDISQIPGDNSTSIKGNNTNIPVIGGK